MLSLTYYGALTAGKRVAYAVTHPEWLWRRIRRAIRATPLLPQALFVIRHPHASLRSIRRKLAGGARTSTSDAGGVEHREPEVSHPATPLLPQSSLVVRHPHVSLRRIEHSLADGASPANAGRAEQTGTEVSLPATPPLPRASLVIHHPRAGLHSIAHEPADRAPPANAGRAEQTESEVPHAVLWFGNAGAPNSNWGMLSLLAAAPALRAVHAHQNLELVIVSNDQDRYLALAGALGVPSRFRAWSSTAVHEELQQADVALLTTGDDDFSFVKSANRAVLALQAGVPVVATPSPALAPFTHCIDTDYARGLRRYLEDRESAQAAVAAARKVIGETFALEPVVRRLEKALEAAAARGRAARLQRWRRPTIAFLIDLVLDLAVLLPVLDAARARNLRCHVIASKRALQENPRLAEALIERRISPTMVDRALQLDARYLRDSDVLLMAAESSHPAHQVAHRLARIAKGVGLRCASIQHGLEMEGLTIRPRKPVVFESDVIFAWGGASALPPFVPADVRGRVIPSGRPSLPPAPPPPPHAGVRVGVFENLHWDRYSARYRRSFEDALESAARQRPDITFMLRPHPAGQWTLRQPRRFERANIQIVNHQDMAIEPLIAEVDAVITTPSTVALDAALAGKRTGVFLGDIADGSAYQPLTLLREASDWLTFIDAAAAGGPVNGNAEFLARSIIPGDASPRILDVLCGDVWPPANAQAAAVERQGPPAAIGANL